MLHLDNIRFYFTLWIGVIVISHTGDHREGHLGGTLHVQGRHLKKSKIGITLLFFNILSSGFLETSNFCEYKRYVM